MNILTTDWRPLPEGGRVPERLLAIGDVHGHAGLLEAMLSHLETCGDPKEAHLVFLGDLTDRGPESLRAIRLAWLARERFAARTYLPGNHEIALMEALQTPHRNMAFHWWFDAYSGSPVCDEVDPDGELDIDGLAARISAELPPGLLDHIVGGPSHYVSGDLLFVHAGIPPYGDRAAFLGMGSLDHHPRGQHWSMIREPFLGYTGGWDPEGRGPTLVVHGHSICARGRIDAEEDFLNVADLSGSHRRIALDLGADAFGQLAALEADGARYRLHLVSAAPAYLP